MKKNTYRYLCLAAIVLLILLVIRTLHTPGTVPEDYIAPVYASAWSLLPPVIANAAMVGMELYYFYNVGFPLYACMLWVGLGEAGACYLLGYPLSLLLDKYKDRIFK